MASDYCYGVELKRALERHDEGDCSVIPVIIRPVDWEYTSFSKLQVLPTDGKPITTWLNRDEAFFVVAKEIRKIVEKLLAQKTIEQWLEEGDIHYKAHEYKEALDAYAQAVQLKPKNPAAHMSKGNVLYRLNRFQEALEAYDQVIRLNPNDVDAYKVKGLALCDLERSEEALVVFDQVIRLNPNDADIYKVKGILLCDLKRYIDVLDAFDLDGFSSLSLLPSDLERYEEALVAFDQAIRLNPNDADVHPVKGLILCGLKRYEEALVAFDQAIRLNPNNANIYKVKGFALFVLKRYEEALAAFDQPFHLDPNDDDMYDNVAYKVKGLALCNLKRYAEATRVFDQAIRLNSNDDDDPYIYYAYRNKDDVLEKLGRERVAQQAYEKAQQIKDDGSYSHPKFNVQTENHTIAIIGENCSAGVSTYIGSLLHELREGKLERRYSNISQGALYKASESQFYNNYDVPLFLNRQKLMCTQCGIVPEPFIYEFVIQPGPWKKAKQVNLIFYDTAGEDILDQRQMIYFASYLFHASGIIFLVDPCSMPDVVQQLSTHHVYYDYRGQSLPSDVLNRVLQTIRQSNVKIQRKFPIPLALTVSKADLLAFTVNAKERMYSFLSEADRNSPLKLRELRSVSNEVRTVIEQIGDKNLLRSAETCSTVEFFAVSATGWQEDSNGQYPAIEPIRCLDPLIWILWQLGVIEATQK